MDQKKQRTHHSHANRKKGVKEKRGAPESFRSKKRNQTKRFLLPAVPTTKRRTTEIKKEEVHMDMTQKRADEIAYLGCISGMSRCCNALAITELTTIEEFLEGNLGMRLVEDIARTLCLKKEEAVEFTRFVFDDVKKALAKMEESRARAEHGVYS